jgi:hypothetical protein
MKFQHSFRFLSVFAALMIAFLAFGAQTVSALPPAPEPVNPQPFSSIVIPTFTWLASNGAAKYEVEVGPQSDPNIVYWSAQTVNLTLTPNDALHFTNIPLYWRVRAYDSANLPGAWSSKVKFTKYIPAPGLVSPTNASKLITPVLAWQAVQGAAYYKVELSTASNFLVVDDTYLTYNTRVIPVSAITHGKHYWRVSGVDAAGHVGTPAGRYFIKEILAPVLVSPTNASNLITPVLVWQAAQGAAYYKVELSTASNFLVVDDTYLTYNTRVIPTNTITHGTHYWRVSGVDATGHVGTPSAGWSFIKDIPAPTLVSPANGNPNIQIPVLEWQAVDGAAYYKVELSTSPTFVPVDDTYLTYNTSITPVDTISHGTHYWRVSSVDADGHVGTSNAGWSFTKNTNAPVLVSPGINASVTEPTMEWQAVDGAAYYKVELSTSPTFVPVLATYNTYNLQITPVDALTLNTYYWRVSGVDAGGHVGNYNSGNFTLNALPAPTDPTPQLISPADTATITTDPTFNWSRVVGAADYRLEVSIYADFHAPYDFVITDYDSYTPYTPGAKDAYPNGTYYWKVKARNSGGTVFATSGARSFTKGELLPLIAPVNRATGLVVDPTFQWNQIVGAADYRLTVSEFADFHAPYDFVITDYDSYTPYTPGAKDAYPNGTYYWKVEARNSIGTVIVTSAARSLTKQEPLPLIAPVNGATGLVVDPTFQWNQIVGAADYRLTVSIYADFHEIYESIITDYGSYTPYNAGPHNAYPNGTYYWKVEARDPIGTVIVTSVARSLTKQEPLPLIAPVNGADDLVTDPTFQWNQIVGAADYRLTVSIYADFHATYDIVFCDYNTYTPYAAGTVSTYARGTYYWKVEARNSTGTVIATSNTWSFTKVYRFYLPITKKDNP